MSNDRRVFPEGTANPYTAATVVSSRSGSVPPRKTGLLWSIGNALFGDEHELSEANLTRQEQRFMDEVPKRHSRRVDDTYRRDSTKREHPRRAESSLPTRSRRSPPPRSRGSSKVVPRLSPPVTSRGPQPSTSRRFPASVPPRSTASKSRNRTGDTGGRRHAHGSEPVITDRIERGSRHTVNGVTTTTEELLFYRKGGRWDDTYRPFLQGVLSIPVYTR